MIYPKDVLDFVNQDRALRERFPDIVGADGSDPFRRPGIDRDLAFERWMVREGVRQSPAVRSYLIYLSAMSNIFELIFAFFLKENTGREGKKDEVGVATSPEEMLHIARSLYILDSYGVEGAVLECGCFKGFSSCCLSWACDYLGRELVVADSFQGLPDVEHTFYDGGDFRGDFEGVSSTISTLGRPRCVRFVKGWFSESLRGFDDTLVLMWLDVDLYQSTLDVLGNVYDKLDPRGLVFSHEFAGEFIDADGLIEEAPGEDVARAFRSFFGQHGVSYRAKFLTGCLAVLVPGATGPGVRLSRTAHDFLVDPPAEEPADGRAGTSDGSQGPIQRRPSRDQLVEERDEMWVLKNQLTEERDRLGREKSDLEIDRQNLQEELTTAWTTMEDLHGSVSFRLGRALTWLPRLVKGSDG